MSRSSSSSSSSSSTYTMPHRDTVAGDAAAKSSGSNIMKTALLRAKQQCKQALAYIVTVELSFTISPDVKHSFLLSSSTVFMDSIHMASIGPVHDDLMHKNGC